MPNSLNHLIEFVACDKVAADGFEVDGLITGKNGFMVERFVNPPVKIYIKLKRRINLTRLVIAPRIGAQSSTDIEIYAVKWYPVPVVSKCNIVDVFSNARRALVKIASYKQNSTGKAVHQLTFGDEKQCAKHQETMDKPVGFCSTFRSSDIFVVRICRTSHGSLACLGSVDFYGNVLKQCPNDKSELFSPAMSKSTSSFTAAIVDASNSNNVNDSTNNGFFSQNIRQDNQEQDCSSANGASVPDDFLDSLTYELMTVPILLPSGHNIDATSLQKLREESSTIGKACCDPFTGQPFGHHASPTLNVELKIRLDSFLSKTDDNFPRVLGKCKRKELTDAATTLTESPPRKKSSSVLVPLHCSKCDVGKTYLYSTECGHYFCRKCLLSLLQSSSKSSFNCHICDSCLLSSDIRFLRNTGNGVKY